MSTRNNRTPFGCALGEPDRTRVDNRDIEWKRYLLIGTETRDGISVSADPGIYAWASETGEWCVDRGTACRLTGSESTWERRRKEKDVERLDRKHAPREGRAEHFDLWEVIDVAMEQARRDRDARAEAMRVRRLNRPTPTVATVQTEEEQQLTLDYSDAA